MDAIWDLMPSIFALFLSYAICIFLTMHSILKSHNARNYYRASTFSKYYTYFRMLCQWLCHSYLLSYSYPYLAHIDSLTCRLEEAETSWAHGCIAWLHIEYEWKRETILGGKRERERNAMHFNTNKNTNQFLYFRNFTHDLSNITYSKSYFFCYIFPSEIYSYGSTFRVINCDSFFACTFPYLVILLHIIHIVAMVFFPFP